MKVYNGYNDTRTVVSFTVTNSGKVVGAEVAQMYLGFPSAAGEPPKQLKGFRVLRDLAAGAKVSVTIALNDRSFSTWDVGTHGWKAEKFSSRNSSAAAAAKMSANKSSSGHESRAIDSGRQSQLLSQIQ